MDLKNAQHCGDPRWATHVLLSANPSDTMKFLLLLLISTPLWLSAQTTWPVTVGGSLSGGAEPYYSPETLTIEVGDTVSWTNVSGTHNVYGSTILFPGNPESFVSGDEENGPWNFKFGFTLPGTYNYHCTSNGHSSTQFGHIIVINTTMVEEIDAATAVNLFPVPASEMLTVDLAGLQIRTADVFDLEGRRVTTVGVNGAARVDIALGRLAAGQYFLRLVDEEGRSITRPFRKE